MSELGKVIEELERLEKAATPGPFQVRSCPKPRASTDPRDDGRIFLLAHNDGTFDCEVCIVQGDESENLAHMLALLRTHAPTLIAAAKRAEQAEAEVERLREALKPFANVVSTSSGRIPVERLALFDWHRAAKALAPPPTANEGATTLEGAGGEVRAQSGSKGRAG